MRHVIVAGSLPFRPSSMIKSGHQGLTSSWRDIAGWTADITGYPGSVVNGNGVLAQADIADAALSSSIRFDVPSGFGAPEHAARILVNGSVVATGTVAEGWDGTMTVSATSYLAVGDRVSVQGWSTHGAWALEGVDTFVRIEVP